MLLVALALLVELAYRLLAGPLGVDRARIADYRHYLLAGALRNYESRAYTVFQRPRGQESWNSLGFSDREWSTQKIPGVPRILCLGGSTTESGNSDALQGSYPYLLERALENSTGRDFEVLNAGISGWTSAEMLVSWFLTLQDFAPDLLVIHEGVNDLHPRFRADFRSDYAHWRTPMRCRSSGLLERFLASWSELYLGLRLARADVPDILDVTSTPEGKFDPLVKEKRLDPATAGAFRRNIASIAASARGIGAEVALMTMPLDPGPRTPNLPLWQYGVREHDQHLRKLAAAHGYLLVDAAEAFAQRPQLDREFLDLVHLTPRGNQAKALLLVQVLLERWVPTLPAQSAESAR
jgi:lysophospholipase L1-like esterase